MKVALDFRSVPHSGIWNYSRQLTEGLQEAGVDVQLVTMPPHLVAASSLAYLQGLRRLVWENTSMTAAFKRMSVELFHCTNNYGIPLCLHCPSVLTVHDFVPLMLSDAYLPQYKKRFAYQLFLNHSIRAANRIITISDFTQTELLRRFPAAAGKTQRVYHGCGKQYRRLYDFTSMDRRLKQFELTDEFVLTMGGTEPRKNVTSLVDIFRQRWKEGKKTPTLAVVGDEWRGMGSEQWLMTPNVRFLGQVKAEQLIDLYNRCMLFVFPSLLEGFGLPVLEAMGCGAPVLAMRSTSIPEVAGDAALLVEPDVAGGLVLGIELLLSDKALRQELTARGLERAANFTWEKTAAETLAVYRDAIAAG